MNGDDLKEARIFLNMTQKQLADRFGLSERTIRNYENGHTDIPITFEMALRALELEEK